MENPFIVEAAPAAEATDVPYRVRIRCPVCGSERIRIEGSELVIEGPPTIDGRRYTVELRCENAHVFNTTLFSSDGGVLIEAQQMPGE